ncbi:hypothetical protein GGR54DRAFT_600582 [Hypoxylon sp. NC1633]|nr:hypothetical protein GGR54DRAFT_600582 [Hypoxylon sp. NC1633]
MSSRNCPKDQSIVYIEDGQHVSATLTYVRRESRAQTLLLKGLVYPKHKVSPYAKVFKYGVVVSLWHRESRQPVRGPSHVIPATPYEALGLPSVPFYPGEDPCPDTWLLLSSAGHSMPHHADTDNSRNNLSRAGSTGPEETEKQVQVPPQNGKTGSSAALSNGIGQGTGRNKPGASSKDPSPDQQRVSENRHRSGRDCPPPLPSGSASTGYSGKGYVPPHLRHLLPRSSTTVATESDEDIAKKPQVKKLGNGDGKMPGEGEQAIVDELAKDDASLQLDQGKQAQDPRPSSQQPKPKEGGEDPFAHTWMIAQAREARKKTEAWTQVRRSTMKQQAGADSSREHVRQGPIPMSMPQGPAPKSKQAMVSQKVHQMMDSLQIYNGIVTLKAELGRICLTNVDDRCVYEPGRKVKGLDQPLKVIEACLDRYHGASGNLLFTNLVSTQTGDARYVEAMELTSGTRMWRGSIRDTVYEIICSALTKENKRSEFVVEVNDEDFSYRVYQSPGDSNYVNVHCPQRTWDFRVALHKSQDLESYCGDFAKDLISSLRVVHQDEGPPVLEIAVKKAYKVAILAARIRNIALYPRNKAAGFPWTILEICEVHDTYPAALSRTEDGLTVKFQPGNGRAKPGQPSTWYEFAVESEVANAALLQNRSLEFGDEVKWTSARLLQAGVYDELVGCAMSLVGKMDGVGHWNNNSQATAPASNQSA